MLFTITFVRNATYYTASFNASKSYFGFIVVMNNVKETPPWLKEEHIPLSEAGGNNVGNYSSGVDNAETEVPRMILFTRLINLALSILMSLVALLSLLTTQSATTGVLACYVVAFSCLLCCFETHLKQMSTSQILFQ